MRYGNIIRGREMHWSLLYWEVLGLFFQSYGLICQCLCLKIDIPTAFWSEVEYEALQRQKIFADAGTEFRECDETQFKSDNSKHFDKLSDSEYSSSRLLSYPVTTPLPAESMAQDESLHQHQPVTCIAVNLMLSWTVYRSQLLIFGWQPKAGRAISVCAMPPSGT